MPNAIHGGATCAQCGLWREKKKDEEIEIGMELTFSLSMNERSPSFSPTKRRIINRRQVKKYENFPEIRGGKGRKPSTTKKNYISSRFFFGRQIYKNPVN